MKLNYQDERGRWYKVELPDGESPDNAAMGVPIGPPDVVDFMEIPEPLATRLHNMLFERDLFTSQDVQRRPRDLQNALTSAFHADVAKFHEAYISLEKGEES